jgi:hypothetical protein
MIENTMNSVNSKDCVNFLLFVLFFLLSASSLEAKVTGVCSNCHTMHNSQKGTNMQYLGPGETDINPKQHLLRGTCIACHSSTNGNTWKNPYTGAPIVFNTSAPTYGASSDGTIHQGLAGGNFYWVADAGGHDDAKGHNVLGISEPDANLSRPPGGIVSGCQDASCHVSLAIVPGSDWGHMNDYDIKNGCEGCHVFTKHHVDEGVYRFLYHHWYPGDNTKTVRGQGDPNWEHNPTSSTHNTYIGADNPTDHCWLSSGGGNISAFCWGCHPNFVCFMGSGGTSGSEPWVRHPSDVVIPSSGEYTGYTSYNPIVPVGRPETDFPSDPGKVRPGTDRVICVSCHRIHGSPYFKMMRWDYNGWPGNALTNGCSICHSSKD